LRRRLDDLIIQALVGAFSVIMFDILMDQVFQMTLPKDRHSIQTFTLDASDKPFNQRIEVGS